MFVCFVWLHKSIRQGLVTRKSCWVDFWATFANSSSLSAWFATSACPDSPSWAVPDSPPRTRARRPSCASPDDCPLVQLACCYIKGVFDNTNVYHWSSLNRVKFKWKLPKNSDRFVDIVSYFDGCLDPIRILEEIGLVVVVVTGSWRFLNNDYTKHNQYIYLKYMLYFL